MRRILLILIVCATLTCVAAPSVAYAQTQIAGCKVSKTQNMSGTRLAEQHYVMEGTADQPVQIVPYDPAWPGRFAALGFQVKEMLGGIAGWQTEGYELDRTP